MKHVVACLLLAGVSGPLLAEELPEVIHLTVSASAAPVPALKYTLLPDARDIKPGNAAVDYYRGFAPEWWGYIQRQPAKFWEDLEKRLTAPLQELNRNTVQHFPAFSAMMRQVDRGARCEICDWGLGPRVAEDGFSTLIPEAQGIRNFGLFLALRARVELAKGRIDACIYTLQTGLQLAQHVADSHSLINHLVGVSCTQMMVRQIEELMQHPHAPNLYWALSQLRRPFLDLRRPLIGEQLMVDRELAFINEFSKSPLPSEEVQRIVNTAWNGDKKQLMNEVTIFWPKAKQALVASGRPAAEVDKMPPLQAVLLWAKAEHDRYRHDLIKWFSLPFAEGREGFERASSALKAAKESKQTLSVVFDLLTAFDKVHFASMRTDRRFAILRCIEAIKLHAADNGTLPQSLDEIKAAPIPLDPMVNKPFEYKLQGDIAVLTAPLYGTPRGNGWRYEITLRK